MSEITQKQERDPRLQQTIALRYLTQTIADLERQKAALEKQISQLHRIAHLLRHSGVEE